MSRNVVIVESPAKCKTINKYLGKDYEVLASFGHIRDLPAKDGSVKPDEDFDMTYQISPDSTKNVSAIVKAVKQADKLILATDPDREGEAISWHVLEALKEKKAIKATTEVERVTFTSITKKAVNEAMESPRELDMNLVNAQQARRALDYLVGFNLSPVLWRKLPGSKSAGRVQSVALRIICEREEEIEAFNAREYWKVQAIFTTTNGDTFTAWLSQLDGKKLDKFAISNAEEASAILDDLINAAYNVTSIERKESQRKPYAPFTTSTLQQDASRKLGFAAKRTMQTAQKLYEGITLDGETTGLITYMRTDGVDVAPEAVASARDLVGSRYGANYLPEKPRFYSSKHKSAQEAHEAIRPTDPSRLPETVKSFLTEDQYRLYDLIWKRMIASQMNNVVLDQVIVDIDTADKKATFHATGSTIRFDGFYKVYREGFDEEPEDDDEKRLPPLSEGESVTAGNVEKTEKNPDGKNPLATQHFTQPPARYTEASLVKKLEELGIGRPSTYASILDVLQARNYVKLEQKRFFPEMRGRIVTKFLEHYFTRYVEYDFTSSLEGELDSVANGDTEWKAALRTFWDAFHANVESAMELKPTDIISELNQLLADALFPGEGTYEERRSCPTCSTGQLSLKTGKFGAFLGCSEYPDCNYTLQLPGSGTEEAIAEGKDQAELSEPKKLGVDPETNLEITLRKGPYGMYVQLGEAVEKKKPKRASIKKGTPVEDVTLEMALDLLQLPRKVGDHPETGKEIIANIGRYGPYIQHDGKFISLKGDDRPETIGMNRAVVIISEAADKKGKNDPLRTVGQHPDDGADINVYDGRYGPYVKHGKTNASLPNGTEVDDVTLEQAVELIAARAKKAPAKKKKAATKKKPATKKKAATKKAADTETPRKAAK